MGEIPKWGLAEKEAAEAVGLGLSTFRENVEKGLFSGPRKFGRKNVYHAELLKKEFDALYGLTPKLKEWGR